MREQAAEVDRPLLIVISDSPRVDAEVRSRDRDVRRWHDGEGEPPDHRWFGGDPTSAQCYDWTRGASVVSAVIDLQPPERARAALHALRSIRPDAAALVLSHDLADVDDPADGTLSRAGRLRDVLRVDLEEELERLEAERRVFCLREFAAGDDIVPILIHPDPDPDAVSSALGVMTLLGSHPERTPIVTFDEMMRPENRRMAELLRIRVTRVTEAEVRRFDRVITVDTQPRGLQQDGRPRVAVIDHHPLEHSYEADFCDVRPQYGATATMITEYLRAAAAKRVHRGLATALLFGIKTDTDSLMRGVTAADVAAYAWLQGLADLQLVRRFEQPSYPLKTMRAYGEALSAAECDDDLCVTYAGRLDDDEAHLLADLADFCLGIENVTWVAVAAEVGDDFVVTLRHTGAGVGAGAVARALAGHGGSGGGHATMARVALPAHSARQLAAAKEKAPILRRLIRDAMRAAEGRRCTSRRDSLPAHPA